MIGFRNKGDFSRIENGLKRLFKNNYRSILEKYAKQGVSALSLATPIDSGETASSWGYEIIQNDEGMSIVWSNSHVEKGINIALILQYGHATRGGGYVEGRDYINPAIRPVFDEMINAIWKEVVGK